MDRRIRDSIDLNKLRTFAVIAEQGGVSAAAERLALTRSAVSHSLTSLEEQLGLPLFLRVGRRLVLTPEGQELLATYQRMREHMDAALERMGLVQEEVQGPIRLGLFLGFSRFRLAATIDGFLTANPDARVRLVYGERAELQSQLLSGKLDLTLSLGPAGRAEGRVRSERLFEQHLVLAARRRPRRVDFEAISQLPIIDYFRGEPLIDVWARHHFGARRLPRRNIRVFAQSVDLAIELVRRGVGACVLPADLVAPYREAGELVVLRERGEPLLDPVHVNQLAYARPGPRLEAFRAHLFEASRG